MKIFGAHLLNILLFFGTISSMGQAVVQNLNANGGTLYYTGRSETFLVPNDPNIVGIEFFVIGASGGDANIHDKVPIVGPEVDCKANGGKGAMVNSKFDIGTSELLKHGAEIKFIVGRRGNDRFSDGKLGIGTSFGGGGGGSAVLLKSGSSWVDLAVAGGGGGAYVGMYFYGCVDESPGQDGQPTTDGGHGGRATAIAGLGGQDGNGGNATGLAGAGGGSLTSGHGIICVETNLGTFEAGGGGMGYPDGGYGGDSDGCTNFGWTNGGFGYGGGGAGTGSGGGGGGYSGGGAGGLARQGGGGGSYKNAHNKSNESIGVGNSSDGYISYRFILNEAPIAKCKSYTLYLNGSNYATISPFNINNGSIDPDGLPPTALSGTLSKYSFTCSNVGSNTVTLTVRDIHGATDACTATVTVVDNFDPIVSTKDITVYLGTDGRASITPTQLDNGSYDACGIKSRTLNRSTFFCYDVGVQDVVLTVTDNNDNMASRVGKVTVVDNLPPTPGCRDITVGLNAAGVVTISPFSINNLSRDNCVIASYALNKTQFNCSNVGVNTVELTVTDIHGNSSKCTATVTVEDHVPPNIITKDLVVHLDETGFASINDNSVDNGSNDACGIEVYETDIKSFDCADAYEYLQSGSPVIVTLTLTDKNGNQSSKTATVSVLYGDQDIDGDDVGDECDICPNGDDAEDYNMDGIPDCNGATFPGLDALNPEWVSRKNPNNPQILICHRSPGNGSNYHQQFVDPQALASHINHGDVIGPCVDSKSTSNEFASQSGVVTVFPNPANDILNIVLPTNQDASIIISITNVLGNIVFRTTIESNQYIPIYRVDLKGADAFTGGVYMVKVASKNSVTTQKVVVN